MVRFGGVQHGLLSAGRRLEHVGTHHTVRGGGVWMGGQSDRNVGQLGKHRLHIHGIPSLLLHGH